MAFNLCSTNAQNTGIILCDPVLGIPSQVLIYNDTIAISSILGTAFQTFLETNSKLSRTATGKVFPYPVILDVSDKTENNTEGSLNQGFKTILREGRPALEFKIKAGLSTIAKLRAFNNTSVNILIADSKNQVVGVKSGANFRGATVNIFVSGIPFADGQAVKEGIATMTVSYLDPKDLNDNLMFGTVTSMSGVLGLLDVDLAEVAARASNVYHIGASIPTAKAGVSVNLHDSYGATLASSSLWSLKTGTTYGTTLAMTSVTDDTVNGGWTITADSTAHTALSSGAIIRFSMAAPATLDAAGVAQVESNYLYLTKP